MSDNPFKALAEAYNETTKQIDEKQGASELYKITFEKISDFLTNVDYHSKDIEYLDGYFIFSHGTNSVINFHIKECPHWKFGIWWDIKNEEENSEDDAGKVLKGEFFCMHERYLDKFKPTRAEFLCEIEFKLNEDMTLRHDKIDKYDLYEVVSIIEFIHNHPYIAYHKDVHGTDYNYHYQSGFWSFLEYYSDGLNELKDAIVKSIIHKKEYNYFIKLMQYYFPDNPWLLNDCGEDCSPRYDPFVFISAEEAQDLGVEMNKCYNLFDNDEDKAQWKKYKKKLNKIAEIFGVCWYGEVATSLNILDIDKLDEYRNGLFKGQKIYNCEGEV